MRRGLFFLLILLLPSLAFASWPISWSWNSVGGGFSCWDYTRGSHSIDSSTTTPDPSSSLKFTYDPYFEGGRDPASCSNTFGSAKSEIYGQYYFKYSSNWTWNTTVNKHVFLWYGPPTSWAGDVIGVARSTPEIQLRVQHAETVNYASNTGYNPVIQRNVWYKATFYAKINTPGAKNGVIKIWINDQLVMHHTDVKYLRSVDTGGQGFYTFALTPTWGGTSGTKSSSEEYLWIDKTIVQGTPIGGETTDTTPPYTSGHSPAKGATGQDNTSAISFHVLDAGDGVSQATIAASIEGVEYTCASDEVSCSGTSADYTFTYTPVSTYGAGETVSVAIDACDAVGNCMATDSYTFQTTFQTTPTTTKTKAQLLEYLGGLSSLGSKKLLSGQRLSTMNTWVASDNTEWNEISALTGGTVPAVAGFDFSCGDTVEACDYAAGIARVVTHWNSGGLAYFTHHAANPTTNKWSWPLGDPSFTFSNIYTPGNTQYTNYRLQLEKIGDAIALLADNNVVIMFAPFHEMNMSSDVFWWSGQSAAQLKLAWEYVRGYMENERGLSNIIWVYAGYPWESDVTTYYSTIGDNNVDVIGIDYYTSNSRFNDSSIISRWNTLAASGKPMAFTELGLCSSSTHTDATCSNGDARTIVNDLSTYFPAATFWMNWDDEDKDYGLNNMTYVPQALSDSRVVVLADNPSGGVAAGTVEIQDTSLPSMTVGTEFTKQLTSILGTSPFTYAVTAGSLPGGITMTTGGYFSGTPTTDGPYDFTVTVTDAVDSTDDQQFTGTISPLLPGGQYTVELPMTLTYINSAEGTTNYASTDNVTAYTWPAYTPANRIIGTVDISSLPALASVTAASVALTQVGYEGAGGATMRLHARRITSDPLPDTSTITWNTFDNTVGSDLSVVDCDLDSESRTFSILSAVVDAKAASATTVAILIDGSSDNAQDVNRIFDDAATVSVTYTLLTEGGVPVSAPGRMRVSRFRGTFR